MTELAVNVTRENSTTLSNNMELAHGQLQNGGNTLLSKMFTADTFGGLGNVQRQHVIPVSVLQDDLNVLFFDELLTATKNSPGGAFALDINDAQNVMYLPKNAAGIAAGQKSGVYAAMHNGNSVVHGGSNTYIGNAVRDIRAAYYGETSALLARGFGPGTPEYTEAAMRAAGRFTHLTNEIRSGSFSDKPDGVKFFYHHDDPLFKAAYGGVPPSGAAVAEWLDDTRPSAAELNGSGGWQDRILPDGRRNISFTNEAGFTEFISSPKTGDINGINKNDFQSGFDRLAGHIQQANPGMSADDARSQALKGISTATDNLSWQQLFDNKLHSGGSKPLTAMLARGEQAAKDAVFFLKDLSDKYPGAGRALALAGLVVALIQADEAEAAGQPDKAKAIMAQWASDEAAGWVLGLAAGVVVGAAAATVLPALGAAAVGAAAGIAADYAFGSDVSKTVLDGVLQGLGKLGFDLAGVKAALASDPKVPVDSLNFGQPPGSLTPPAQNPTVVDVSVDTINLKPDPASGLGATENGQGVLQSGAGFVVKSPANFVNDDGLANTASSNIVANGTRPGDKNLNPTDALMNSMRAQMNDVRAQLGNAGMAGTLVAGQGVPAGTAYSAVEPVDHISGVTFEAEVFYSLDGTMIGFAPTSAVTAGTDHLQAGVRYVPSSTSGSNSSGWSAGGLQPHDGSAVLLYRQIGDKVVYTDPLSLDQGGDGISFSPAPVSFDANGDGEVESLPWPITSDPLLVFDANGDGNINNGRELIGLSDSTSNAPTAALNLMRMDANGDKVLNAADPIFAKLQLWGDANLDGYAQSYERRGLSDVGIVSIDLDPAHVQAGAVGGRSGVKGVKATYADGSTRILWDLPFDAPSAKLVTTTTANYRPGVDKIASSSGAVLMAHDEQGVALDLNGSGAAQAMGRSGNDTLIGTAAEDWLIGGAGADKFAAGAGNDLLVLDANDKQADIDAGAGIDTALIADDRGMFLNLAQARVEVVYGGYGNDVLLGGGADNYVISAASGDDIVIGGSVDDVLDGDDGQDALDGGKGDDLMRGGRGQDVISGGEGNDVLDGGLDDDTLQGGVGNDVIVASGGRDTVDGGQGTDLIELRGALEDYRFQVSGTNSDGSKAWLITDTKNSDGSTVASGQVSNRDGIQQVRDVERFSYRNGVGTSTRDLGMAAPLPVNDRAVVSASATSYAINITSLIANDIDFQNLANPQLNIIWFGDAVGGSVTRSGANFIFTPTSGYTGPMEFAYTVQDRDRGPNSAPTVSLVDDPSQKGIMKARVILAPDAGLPDDPDFAKQWYLGAVDAPAVWKAGYTGKGVKVLVLEGSGTFAVSAQVADLNSADLLANRSTAFIDTAAHNDHATAVAGVIGAARNGIGGVGVSYDATLNSMSLPMGNNVLNDSKTLALMHQYDVVNNSWKYADPWNVFYGTSSAITAQAAVNGAIGTSARSGRNGLGTVMVFGAGNDRATGHDSGLSVLTANQYTITVGAINRVGAVGSGNAVTRPFSERGANILVSAPGSSIQTTSTMVQTADGTVLGSPTAETQGTSFAAPIVSGVAALMLQANPKLNYRDVQTILALTAKKDFGAGAVTGTTWASNKADDWNGVGMHFSADYGFGMVDADAAVRMAESWVSEQGHLASTYVKANTTAEALADQGTRSLTFTVTNDISVEQAILSLKLDHERWSDLVVKLTSPKGTTSLLLDRPNFQDGKVFASNPAGELRFDQNLMSTHFRGESAVGTWTLTVQDAASGGVGSGSITADLQVVGTDARYLKHYTVTDEYAGNWTIAPVSDRPSELNASAVSKSVRLDLGGGASHVGGKAITLGAGLDRLVGGLGADTLIGAGGDETLIGGAGGDTLSGGAGYDELDGGVGNDALDGGVGGDLLMAGQGNDTLTGGADADIFLIDGNSVSTTTIKDFNVAAGGDTLRVRTQNAISWAAMTQTMVDGKLQITAGAATVLLEGVTTKLSNKQLVGMAAGDAIPVDPSGRYAPGRTVYVEYQGEVRHRAAVTGFGNEFTGFGSIQRNGALIQYGGVSGDTMVNGEPLGYYDSGVRTTRPIEPEDYWVVGLGWTPGTDGDDVLLPGRVSPPLPGNIKAPERFQQKLHQEWERLLPNDMHHKPVYRGMGGNDEIVSDDRHSVLLGDDGADKLTAGGGNDTLFGGVGDDFLTGGKGNDILVGGEGVGSYVFTVGDGQDVILAKEFPLLIGGRELSTIGFWSAYQDINYAGFSSVDAPLRSNDVLVIHGTNAVTPHVSFSSDYRYEFNVSTTVSYGDGGDTINLQSTIYKRVDLAAATGIGLFNAQFDDGSSNAYVLNGKTISDGADAIDQVKYGSRNIRSLAGDDLVFALINNTLDIDGGSGNDTVYALEGGNTLQGGDGQDRLEVAANAVGGQDTLIGGKGDDTLVAGDSGALMYGDYIDATAAVSASSYGDKLVGGGGADTLHGGHGIDLLFANMGDDSLYGEAGNDILNGGNDNDRLFGGIGDDVLNGDDGHDALHGGDGIDNLLGGQGNDHLYGDVGNDVLLGGDDDDVLDGGVGNDYFDSGSGHDTLNLGLSSGNDTVANATGVDVVRLNGVENIGSIQLSLLDNGAGARISWAGEGSLTYNFYNLDTQIWLDNNVKTTLRAIFNGKGLKPDESFQFLSQYDVQLVGDTTQIGTLIGDKYADQLFGGPKDTAIEDSAVNGVRYGEGNSAYWYVLGGAGEDSIAAGKSGAILDGGMGDDKIRASDGVTVLRDTFHGGKDTLVMPEGLVPEALRFFRVANPLEAPYFDTSLTTSELVRHHSQVLPSGSTWLQEETRHGDWYGNLYQGNRLHYDTLRVQSIDGKFTVDLVAYFENGSWKNDINKMLFTTVFDAQGNSTTYSIDDLVKANSKDALYQLPENLFYYNHVPALDDNRNTFKEYESLLDLWLPDDSRATLGGESGTRLTGRVKLVLGRGDDRYAIDYHKLDSTIIGLDRSRFFDREQSNDDRLKYFYNYRDTDNLSPTDVIFKIALPDYILGFGGDDTIDAGGTYVNYLNDPVFSPHKERYRTYFETYGVGTQDFGGGMGLEDRVNGGAGNDTYIFSSRDSFLHIIGVDEVNAGAEGIDTLNLSWQRSTNVDLADLVRGGGAGVVSWFEIDGRWSSVFIDPGKNGHLQVDRIVFSDKTINVRDILKKTSADQRSFDIDFLDHASVASSGPGEARFSGLINSLDDSATLSGTPKDDVILVPSSGVVHGAEGADTYFIGLDSTDFTVVALDKGDTIRFVGESFDWASSAAPYWATQGFAGGSLAGQYLGKSVSDWVASGVVPLDLDESGSRFAAKVYDFWPYGDEVHGRAELFYGKLLPATTSGASSYALSDWQSADGSFDDITDALVAWQTIGADGKVHDHHVVLAGAVDAVGYDLSRYAVGNAGVLSQGSDYFGGLIGWSDNPEADITTIHALGGDDTVAAYTGDVFAGYAYRGLRDVIFGGSGNDSLDGGAGDDSLHGGVGQDTLIGGFGRDLLNGGGGLDTLIGGTGDDVYVVDGSDVIVEEASPNYRITINVEGVPVYESTDAKMFDMALWSSYSQSMGSMTSDERTWALGLPTTPTTEAAKAALENSSPHENGVTYRLSWRDVSSGFVHTDVLRFQVTSEERGIDEVQGDLDLDLRDSRYANVESATALGTTARRLIGTDGDNVLRSNGAGSTLEGLGGNDLYYVLAKGDRVLESADSGKDTIFSFTDIDRLADNVEDLYSKGSGLTLTGNALDNRIVGDDQANLLNGGQGADTLQAGLGDDSYVVSGQEDTIVETSGGGKDTVWVNRSLTLGAAATNDIEFMRAGSSFGVFMKGNQLSQHLVGAAGEDTLDGGGGADSLYGGSGNDTYIVNSAADLVVEDADAGNDTIQVAYSNLGSIATVVAVGKGHLSNVENAAVTGIGLFNLQGDANDNRLTGNTANNHLDGGEGADTLTGGFGDDTYVIDSTEDVITEIAGEGSSDTVHVLFSGSYDLSDTNVENLVAEGGSILATGNASDNHIVGSASDDSLFGMAGDDTLVAGGGYDRLHGGEGQDTYEVDFLTAAGVEIAGAERGYDTLVIKGVALASDLVFNRVMDVWYAEDTYASFQGGPGSHLEIGLRGGNGPVIVVHEYFNADGSQSGAIGDIVVGGTTLSFNDVKAGVTKPATSDGDLLYGFAVREEIAGLDGNDTIDGAGGDDILLGGRGVDYITGSGLLDGGDDSDRLVLREDVSLEKGSVMRGGAGNDHLNSAEFSLVRRYNALLDGGIGDDTYVMAQSDMAVHRQGDGSDVISRYSGASELRMEGLRLSDLLLGKTSWSKDLIVATKSGLHDDQVTVQGYFKKGAAQQLKLSVLNEAGSAYVVVTAATISSMATAGNALNNVIVGTDAGEILSGMGGNDEIDGQSGDDRILGGDGNDTLTGHNGNDELFGESGSDWLNGGAGDDRIQGGDGNDTLVDWGGTDLFEGEAGNDVFYGGGGGDTYIGGAGDDVFNHYVHNGAGNLTIIDSDSTVGNQDLLQMDANPYAVVFKQSGNDLLMIRMDAASSVTVKDWFSGSASQIESIKTSAWQDDYTLLEGQLSTTGVQQLLQAMASFTPAVGQSVITGQTNHALHAAIQQAWGVQTSGYSD